MSTVKPTLRLIFLMLIALLYSHRAYFIGVPVSTQWESGGYYYPTQIAQFGLSHYSKNLTEPEPRRKVIEDGERDVAHWVTNGPAAISRAHDGDVSSVVLQFQTAGTISNISISYVQCLHISSIKSCLCIFI